MSGLATRFFISFTGKQIGTDEFGNRYYMARKPDATGRYRRFVLYRGKAEPSKIPAAWHGWLHYTVDTPPSERYDWQKPHIPNLTGTTGAYLPPGHLLKGGKRNRVSSDYQPWNPESKTQ